MTSVFPAYWLGAVALGLMVTALARSAALQDGAERTVSWFADHPQERARVELKCIDDPGHLGRTPDCINARQAAAELSYRYSQRVAGARYKPNDPKFWSQRPLARADRLNICHASEAVGDCAAARASLMQDAGLGRK